jgi:hypothetical protein
MEKINWGVKIFEIVITVLFTTLVSIIITYVFGKEQCNIDIGTSVLSNNQYYTSITISNSGKNKAIKKLEISTSDFNEIEDGIMNLSYNLDKSNNVLTINYIPPDETFSLFIITKNVVNLNSIRVAYDGKINTTYLKDKTSFYIVIISQVIIYTIMLIILQIIDYKRDLKRNEKFKEVQSELDEYQRIVNAIKVDYDIMVEKDNQSRRAVTQFETKLYRMKIYYLARMNDYSKELDFWKDTIRKIMYQKVSKKKDNEEVFDIVTKELKTYGTRSKTESYYDELSYLAQNMKDIEKEIK